ncbi:MAG TPA: tetratricopeptide repeat protein [Usitatibacter sp.]|nr:tetratricopeptide repeat protein [Usitatibacter sp.]
MGARAFDVLMALIDHRDRVVSKNELLDMVWPGLVVEENNLQVQVSSLRKVLGAQSVATVPGRGYRFTLEPEAEEAVSCALPARRHNLPAQLTSFIGREQDIAEVRQCLAAKRLVTLTSVGGTGKSRLSLQVAAQVVDQFADGVWFVELAPVADERRVPHAVASVLGVKEEAGRPVIEALLRLARDRQMLVVLDNCEHVLQACAELAKQLLQAGDRVKILASSREQLHVAGEAIYPVGALDDAEAMRLFVDRSVAVQPAFVVTTQNSHHVAGICRRLDGLPLAIELAAARMRAMSVETVSARLNDCFRVLTGGDATALPRQQTLRASIDWSYDLLEVSERVLLRRLAVFAGGWTLEAAEAVTAGGDVDEAAVIDLLTRLVDKSLVEFDRNTGRYRLLETVRQYALELLVASGEADATRTRHLQHFVALAEAARTEITGPSQASWLARLDVERENILTAHAWCDQVTEGVELGLRLAYSIKAYWVNRGLLELGYRLTLEALSRARASDRGEARCGALFIAGQLACFMGRYTEARRYLEESLAIARELGDPLRIAQPLQPLGAACLGEGDLETARGHLEEAMHRARESGRKREVAAALNMLAQLHRVEGSFDAAELLFREVIVNARELGDIESIAIGLLNRAMIAVSRHAADEAAEMLLETIAINHDVDSKAVAQSVLEASCGLASFAGEWERAARYYGCAERLSEQTGIHRDPADNAFVEPRVALAREKLGAAAFTAAEAQGRALGYHELIAEARDWLTARRYSRPPPR